MSKVWPKVRLGDVLTQIWDEEAVDPERTYRLLGARWYAQGLFIKDVKSGQEIRADRTYRMHKGSFVYNRLFAWKGSFALAGDADDGCYVSNEFPCFAIDRSRLDGSFLSWYFGRASAWTEALGLSVGGTPTSRNRLNESRFLAMEIPLPPLAEQRRVVARIEELARRIQEARGLRQQAMEAAEALWASLLTKTLSHTDTVVPHDALPDADQAVRRGVVSPVLPSAAAAKWQIPRGWRRVSVAELLQRGLLLDVKDGNHGANHPRSAEFVEHGTPFLMASDLHDGKVQWNSASRLGPETISRLKVGFASRGDVFFTHKASIGKTAIADRDCILSPQVTYYRCNPAFIEPRWLRAFLGSQLFLLQLSDIQSQTTRDFVSIGKQYQQFILLPPLSEQHRIAEELDSLQAQVESLKRVQAETAAKLDALLPAILDRAFKGELV